MSTWYTRPVFFVAEMKVSSDFYTGRLGFEEAWSFEDKGKKTVAQVTRGDCEIILAEEPERAGNGRLFVSLEPADLEALQKEIEEKSIDAERTWWGYPVIKILDPDGNELLFPVED
jgi:catechol 2,3-dioxygenase-like lactoylglutathione lyase family enzyme